MEKIKELSTYCLQNNFLFHWKTDLIKHMKFGTSGKALQTES